MKTFAFVLVVFTTLLAGCAQQELRKDVQAHDEICDMKTHSDLANLNGLMPLNNAELKNISLKMLANNSIASDAEKESLEKYDAYMSPCISHSEQMIKKHFGSMPEVYGLHKVLQTGYKNNLSLLYTGKITYGEYNKNIDMMNAKWIEASTNIAALYQRRQQDAAREMGNIYLQQMLKQPSYTNCIGMGNTVNCTTR